MRTLALILTLSLALAACGNGDEPTDPAPGPNGNVPVDIGSTPLVAGEKPEETFAAFRAATLRKDWNALYELSAPSEREESEARWEKVKHDPSKEEMLAETASAQGLPLADLRAMSLREYFLHRNAKQAAGHHSRMLKLAHDATFVGTEPIEGEEDVVMVTFRIGENEPDMPMKRENGRWYIWKVLTAITTY